MGIILFFQKSILVKSLTSMHSGSIFAYDN